MDCIRSLSQKADIIALQETWLLPHDLSFLGTIDDGFSYIGVSSVDTSLGILRGRPYGGVAILWRKSLFQDVTVISCNNVRLAAIRVSCSNSRSFLVITVYMPTDCSANLSDYTDCLSEISAIIESSDTESVYILGDFNAHPGTLFGKELLNFCSEEKWTCVDLEILGSL